MSKNDTPCYNFLASIDVDAQQCFTQVCPDELPVPDGHQIVDQLNDQARYTKLRIGSKDAHSPKALWVTTSKDQIAQVIDPAVTQLHQNIDSYWPVHAIPGTQGFELLDGLPRPAEYDYFVWKGIELDMHTYGACYHDLHNKVSTGLIEYLRVNQITQVVVGGLSLEFCVYVTVIQLALADFKVIVNLGATRFIDQQITDKAMRHMKTLGVTFISSSKELPEVMNGN